MEYRNTKPMMKGPEVLAIQKKLNQARLKAVEVLRNDINMPQFLMNQCYFQQIKHRDTISPTWHAIEPDGKFGDETEKAVKGFQHFLFITENGIMGTMTQVYLDKFLSVEVKHYSQELELEKKQSNNAAYKQTIKKGATATYGFTKNTITTTYKVDSIVNPGEKGLALVFSEWEKVIDSQHDGLMRRLDKFPANKVMRERNVTKQLSYCRKFLDKARKYGVNTAAVELGTNLTKENAIKYIKEVGEAINGSNLTKGIKVITKSFEKVKKIIAPVVNVLNKIPGLKYFSVIEKLAKGTIKMFQKDFEGAFKLYLDALRELLEQILIDMAVVAAIALGGWIALVIVVVVIIGSLIIDYFFFSDNPGDSLVDKWTGKRVTGNVLTEQLAPAVYHTFYE